MKRSLDTFLHGSVLTQTWWQTEMPDAQGGVKKDFNSSFTPDRLCKQIFRLFFYLILKEKDDGHRPFFLKNHLKIYPKDIRFA